MKTFHLSSNPQVFQNKNNADYPEIKEITSFDVLKEVASHDHVGATYKNNHRSKDDFIYADCVLMDIDNSESDNSLAWITPEEMHDFFKNVECAVIYSRNHMKEKDGKAPRPKFHVYFPLRDRITNHEDLRNIKERLIKKYSPFDTNAKDAARFFYGVENPDGLFFKGEKCIDETYLPEIEPEIEKTVSTDESQDKKIISGNREVTLHEIAYTNLLLYDKDKARKIFDDAVASCKPPLPANEVLHAWNSAEAFVLKVKKQREERVKKELDTATLEKIICKLNITVVIDAITGKMEVCNLPENSPLIHEKFKINSKNKQKRDSVELLPLFLTSYLKKGGYKFTADFLRSAISVIASSYEYNPVLQEIEKITWDRQDRILDLREILHIQCLNFESIMLKKWLVQCIAMLNNDDCKINNDFVLVLQGAQGLGKTFFFKQLALNPEFFCEGATIDMRDKDSIINATSCWICELGELDSTLKKEQSNLKAFITANKDRYRAPYARNYTDRPRRTAFCATVNPERFLRDETGSRRFVTIHVDKIDLDKLKNLTTDFMFQLWRQVYEIYLQDKNYYRLTRDEIAENEQRNVSSSVYLPCELEILEGMNWEGFIDFWTYKSASQVRDILGLKVDVRQIGKALARISEYDKRVKKKRDKHYSFVYFLPNAKSQSE